MYRFSRFSGPGNPNFVFFRFFFSPFFFFSLFFFVFCSLFSGKA